MIRFLAVLLLVALVSACSEKKYQQADTFLLEQYACPITQGVCDSDFGELRTTYTLLKEGNTWSVLGKTKWTSQDESAVLERIPRLDLYFVFLEGGKVVYEEKFRVTGVESRPISFSFEFETERPIDKSVIAEYRILATE